MSFTLEGPVLEGTLVRLEPLDHRHGADLAVAAEEDRTSYRFTWVPTAAEVEGYIDAQLARAAAGKLAPYAQVEQTSGRAVGATAYWDPRLWPDGDSLCAIEVGFHLARGVGPGHRSEHRGQVLAVPARVRELGSCTPRLEDGRTEQPFAGRDRTDGRTLRGRAAELVPVLGTRRERRTP